jgi:hypothetical protein
MHISYYTTLIHKVKEKRPLLRDWERILKGRNKIYSGEYAMVRTSL